MSDVSGVQVVVVGIVFDVVVLGRHQEVQQGLPRYLENLAELPLLKNIHGFVCELSIYDIILIVFYCKVGLGMPQYTPVFL